MLPTFRSRKDRLRPYMEKQLKDTLFVELPVDALTDEADLSFMKGVPLPIKKEDLADISGTGISAVKLADNIAVVIGSDTQFKYAAQYIRFLNRLFDARLIKVFSGKAGEYARWACNLHVGCSNDCDYCYCKRGVLGSAMGAPRTTLKKCFKN